MTSGKPITTTAPHRTTRLAVLDLHLSHFRSHRLTRIEADQRPVAIYGPNGAGKTNILEAISLLSPGRGLRRAAASDIVRRPEALGWKVSAALHSLSQRHEIETSFTPDSARQVSIDGKNARQTALGRLSRVLWLTPQMDRLWTEGADGRRRFLDRMALTFHPDHADVSLAYDKAMRERNRLLRDQVTDPHWYRALEAQLAQNGARIIANRANTVDRVDAAQRDAATAFPVASLALVNADDSASPATEDDLASALEASRPRDLVAGRTLVGPHRADLSAIFAAKGAPAADSSTGEQKALLISLVLANARALADDFGAPPILLLDEIAAHLDADRRAALYDEICALGAQAWMTGTGLELFSDLGDRAAYLEVTDDAGITNVVQSEPPE